MKELDSTDFYEFIRRNRIAVIDFWAPWCKPCFTMEKLLKEIEKDKTHIAFGKINTDENLEIARNYNVLSLPTIIIFLNGEEHKRIVGTRSKEDIEEEIRSTQISNFF